MAIPISLPDSLWAFLNEEMREHGHGSLDACAAFLLRRHNGLGLRSTPSSWIGGRTA